MSDLKHRTLPELKAFVKKYNDHFKITVGKVKKADLLNKIDVAMMKAMSPDLQKGLKAEYNRLKELKKEVKNKVVKKPADPPSTGPSKPAESQRKGRKPKVSEPIPESSMPKKADKLPERKSGKVPKGSHKMPDGSIMKDKDMPKSELNIGMTSSKVDARKKLILDGKIPPMIEKPKKRIIVSTKAIKEPKKSVTKKEPKKSVTKKEPKKTEMDFYNELVKRYDEPTLRYDFDSVEKKIIKQVMKKMVKQKIISENDIRPTIKKFTKMFYESLDKKQKEKIKQNEKMVEEATKKMDKEQKEGKK